MQEERDSHSRLSETLAFMFITTKIGLGGGERGSKQGRRDGHLLYGTLTTEIWVHIYRRNLHSRQDIYHPLECVITSDRMECRIRPTSLFQFVDGKKN